MCEPITFYGNIQYFSWHKIFFFDSRSKSCFEDILGPWPRPNWNQIKQMENYEVFLKSQTAMWNNRLWFV